uniref:Protein farnesyltransferase/geranylgeranyltransferase type-1 subunit alpha n=1 Tax=Rhizochromulina marina TaxID=1034831 RepID=A0A7S2R4Z8_9STRA|mmetsp:Transcript_11011/g.31585  ORF Transcript_11011/g.31585 Transcript_11011/m.31585 type:complete len:358 (+) Transcript_11011:70-1143(+)
MAEFEAEVWEGVVPLAQDDGPEPVVAISYAPEYTKLMDLFRRVMATNELSARALALTAQIIQWNAAHYTVWQYRRRCLEALRTDLRGELRYVESVAYDNPKNYQIWFHRRAIVERLGDPAAELQFVANILEEDGKNYHAWSHRQWVLKTYSLWDEELAFLDTLLLEDLYNNSAWNQRWFVVQHTEQLTHDILTREVQFAFTWIRRVVKNESPWNYIRGLMRDKASASGWRFQQFPLVEATCRELRETEDGRNCTFLLGMLYEILESRILQGQLDEPVLEEAAALLDMLGEVDGVRKNYWEGRRARVPAIPRASRPGGEGGTGAAEQEAGGGASAPMSGNAGQAHGGASSVVIEPIDE